MQKLLSIKDAADYMDVSQRTVSRMLKNEDLPFYQIGSRKRISIDDIESLKVKTACVNLA